MLGHGKDEIALVRFEAFKDGVELVRQGPPVSARARLDKQTVSTPALASAIVGGCRLDTYQLAELYSDCCCSLVQAPPERTSRLRCVTGYRLSSRRSTRRTAPAIIPLPARQPVPYWSVSRSPRMGRCGELKSNEARAHMPLISEHSMPCGLSARLRLRRPNCWLERMSPSLASHCNSGVEGPRYPPSSTFSA